MPVELAKQAIERAEIVYGRLQRGHSGEGAPIILDIAVPLIQAVGDRPVGAAVLRVNANSYLFPLIQRWPISSGAAEFVLFRREGEEIVYLNDLRHRKGTALVLRYPLTKRELPAAQAALAPGTAVEGVDYRGVPVIGVSRVIKATGWILLAKKDKAEYLAPINRSAASIVGFLFVLLAGSGGLVAMRSVHQRETYDQRLRLERLEREALAKHFDYGIRYARDIVLMLDADRRVIECNEAALAAYGYSREELIGRNGGELRAPEARATLERDFELVEQQAGRTFETLHQRKDGSTFPTEISSRLVEIDGRRFYQSILRDITERKAAEQRVRSQADDLQSLSRKLIRVQEDERGLISRELHDQVGQTLTALKISLQVLDRLVHSVHKIHLAGQESMRKTAARGGENSTSTSKKID